MYSGSTLRFLKYFDAWFGAHQKIDRIARLNLLKMVNLPGGYFPSIRAILRFEGIDGPDGMKRKNPAKDEPWHFYDPHDPSDKRIFTTINAHHTALVQALRDKNDTRASFEAAWLAHAVVDGLTPAHHYPYEEELMKLRNGEGNETRDSIKDKLLIPGPTTRKMVRNNWKMWGDKGLMASHLAFEWGVAAMIPPLRIKRSFPIKEDVAELKSKGFEEIFKERAHTIAELNMYTKFCKSGWTPKLAKQVRQILVPLIVNAVTLAWYQAVLEARPEGD